MVNLIPPINPNYAAVVTELRSIVPLEGCDNIVGAPVLGYQAIVSKDHRAGDIGIVFTAETALNKEFARANNLYRHSDLNADPAETGYLDDSGRVKAIKLRGHRSDALFLPLSTLAYTGIDVAELRVGDTFDVLGDHGICGKYEIKRKRTGQPGGHLPKRVSRIDEKYFPAHFDTTRYWGNEHRISPDAEVVVTQKLHGTSIRIGNVQTKRRWTFRDRIASRILKVPVAEHMYSPASGSRKVIKHGEEGDLWTEYAQRLEGLIPQGYVVYGELIGWEADGKAIQRGYTYGVPERTADFYVYRVAHINPQGLIADLAWDQVEEFCAARGMATVPVLWRGRHKFFNAEIWPDRRFHDEGLTQAVPLSGSKKLVDEGVCVRADGLIPTILKIKSPIFLQHETKELDKGEIDLESMESAA